MELRQRFRAWCERRFGVKCLKCYGSGRWSGYSPTASLKTIRPWITTACPQCYGRGSVSVEVQQRQRANEEFWTSGRWKVGLVADPVTDGEVVQGG